jgi:deazaflavin-dependent oxidoreductase (nitroreductase family)
MAYLKPNWFITKVFNRIAMATGISGTETLTLAARSSGRPQQIPVLSVEVDGTRYLVSTRGDSQWVKNVRANPTVSLTTKSGTARFTATEVPVAQRDPIIRAYRAKAGKMVDGYFAKLPDPADHPVFSLAPPAPA